MSTIRANIYSDMLKRKVNISVVLPIETGVPAGGFKTLYLLNGYMGDDLDWLSETRIKRLAENKHIAVVMPSGENGFYIDDPAGRRNFSQYIGEELVDITRKMFPLSANREDTMIAGLSMGGYGALLNGLKYNQTFGTIGAFSLALVNELYDPEESKVTDSEFINRIFGVSADKLRSTMADPRTVLERLHGPVPKIYIACGTEDFALQSSQAIHHHLELHRINHQYILSPGAHDWDYWNEQIEQFIEWL